MYERFSIPCCTPQEVDYHLGMRSKKCIHYFLHIFNPRKNPPPCGTTSMNAFAWCRRINFKILFFFLARLYGAGVIFFFPSNFVCVRSTIFFLDVVWVAFIVNVGISFFCSCSLVKKKNTERKCPVKEIRNLVDMKNRVIL